MSELSDIKKSLDDLTNIVTAHIATTNAYRDEKDRVFTALTNTVWDKDGRPGIATKLDRLEQIENQRGWLFKTVAAAVVALGLDRVWHLFK